MQCSACKANAYEFYNNFGKRRINPLMPTGAFNICCPRDCVSRHNGGTSGAPLKPLRDDSALSWAAGLITQENELQFFSTQTNYTFQLI